MLPNLLGESTDRKNNKEVVFQTASISRSSKLGIPLSKAPRPTLGIDFVLGFTSFGQNIILRMGFKKIFRYFRKERIYIKGNATKDKKFRSKREFPSSDIAIREFVKTKARLFDVNGWSDIPGINSAFQIHGTNGHKSSAIRPEIGDYIYIDLPGPDPVNWVKVIALKEKEDLAEFSVKPSSEPNAVGDNAKEIKHFFTDKSTSTFRVKRKDNMILAYQVGKDEAINNKGIKAGKRKLLNTIIAEIGWLGLQRLQWEDLTNYLVGNIKKKNN